MMDTDHDIFRAELRRHRDIAVVTRVNEGGVIDVGLVGHLLVTAFVVFVVFVIVVFVVLVVFVVFVTIVVFALNLIIRGERKNILSRLVVRGGFKTVIAGEWFDVSRLVRGAQRSNAPPSRRPHRAIRISTKNWHGVIATGTHFIANGISFLC